MSNGVWNPLQTTGDIPPAASQHTLSVLDDKIVLMGGETLTFKGSEPCGISLLDLPSCTWTSLSSVAVDADICRAAHGAAVVDDTKVFSPLETRRIALISLKRLLPMLAGSFVQ